MNSEQSPGHHAPSSQGCAPSELLLGTLQELRQLLDAPNAVHNAEQMLAMERQVVALTDRLAGAVVGAMTARALEDSQVKTAAAAIIHCQRRRMKNVGVRSVAVQPMRGEAFTVEITYHHRKKKGSTPR